MRLDIVLVEPEIPQNTGNIARTCTAAGCSLHLVKPLGFSLSDRYLKRAGLDYWERLDLFTYESLDEFMQKNTNRMKFYVTTKASYCYSEVMYPPECMFLFGKETAGLPESLLRDNAKSCIRIPMLKETRSLNLSNSVAIVLYEALRQKGFEGMQKSGLLKNTKYDKSFFNDKQAESSE